MAESPKLTATQPKNVLSKPLKFDFKDLFKALSKGIGHAVGFKWGELANDTVEALCAIGLSTEPGELAFLLLKRSLAKCLFELVGESVIAVLPEMKKETGDLVEQLDYWISFGDVQLDASFLKRPSALPLVADVESLLRRWLEAQGVDGPKAKAIAARLPAYFLYALNQEWRRNAKSYRPLLEAIDTPFAKASDREWAWTEYAALLERRIDEGIFGEPFSLRQMFVPLLASYEEDTVPKEQAVELGRADRQRRRVVLALEQELDKWLEAANPQDPIRVISGGPGSGKSSFARIFAARMAKHGKPKVLFVPLHLIDPSKELAEEVGRFARDEGVLLQNPLDPESPESNLLIILDGLDELASQGKAAAETARAFIREVERTVEKRNLQSLKLRVLISGRELVVQENESEFRRARQVLTLLPYYVSKQDRAGYHDPSKLLEGDLRQQWWKTYGELTGRHYGGLPKQLSRDDLDEITAQPLLNYLVALSYSRDKLDFTKDINLNAIYADLVAAVHERGYEKHRPYGPIRHMKLHDFERVLEEIGLAAWHGDGRTTTVSEIEQHCRASGVGVLLDVFQEGAKAGVTRLLAAFFFRQYGQRASGDPTFVFTHKSFGEYLAARRIVRAVERVIRELERRVESPDEGWDERDALKHWAQICGPSAISRYLHTYLLNEVTLHAGDELGRWQVRLAALFSYMLRHGMPMEQLQLATFKEALFQSRNAEEALLVALNACARQTGQVSAINYPDSAAFGAWFKRIQGQRIGPECVVAADCLSFLDLQNTTLYFGDFYGSNFECSKLDGTVASITNFGGANFRRATAQGAYLTSGQFHHVNFQGAKLQGASLQGSKLEGANLEGANLEGANLEGANLEGANLEGAQLEGANLKKANLEGAQLKGANLKKANLEGANVTRTILEGRVHAAKD
jgi:uncharacterized protein YjbI with pentapeptide repeats